MLLGFFSIFFENIKLVLYLSQTCFSINMKSSSHFKSLLFIFKSYSILEKIICISCNDFIYI